MHNNPAGTSAGVIIRRVVFTLLLAANILFIFYNSSQIGSVSSEISLNVLQKVNSALQRMGTSFQFSHTAIRKLGHLGEYTLLGIWLMLALRVYSKRLLAHISWPLLGGLLVAVCDEFYQTFVPGREGAVRDVLIDFAGVCLGILLAFCALLVCKALWQAVRKKPKPA